MLRPTPLLLPIFALASACNNRSDDARALEQTTSQPRSQAIDGTIRAINEAAPPRALPLDPPRASTSPDGTATTTASPTLATFIIRAEVLLARAHFSPGVVDGEMGSNLTHALRAYQQARGLRESGEIDTPTWRTLLAEPSSSRPVAGSYILARSDVAGPFSPAVGDDLVKLAALPGGPGYSSVIEALAERYRMSQALVKALNPQTTFATAGEHIRVVDASPDSLGHRQVAQVDVSKSNASALVLDNQGRLIAFYPATVGSTERPSPSGIRKVVGVARNPDYTYDPAKLGWGPRHAGKLVIKPGPNNPVGTVWIELNAPGYGIHGSPEPDRIGKTASHGCVRLTNWDADDLAAGISTGVKVNFIGGRGGGK